MSMFPTRRDSRGLARRFFDDDFDTFFSNRNPIKTDIRETATEYILDCDLPGFSKEDITISYDHNVLSLSAQKESGKDETDEETGEYIRRERSTSSFNRQFLVQNVAEDQISAKFDNGVLTIVLPKADPEKDVSRRIEID